MPTLAHVNNLEPRLRSTDRSADYWDGYRDGLQRRAKQLYWLACLFVVLVGAFGALAVYDFTNL